MSYQNSSLSGMIRVLDSWKIKSGKNSVLIQRCLRSVQEIGETLLFTHYGDDNVNRKYIFRGNDEWKIFEDKEQDLMELGCNEPTPRL